MNPYLKRWQRMNKHPRDGETWEQFYERLDAQAIEARQGGDAKQAPSQDESAVGTMRPESGGIQP